MKLHPPDATVSQEEAFQVYNADLKDLSLAELEYERWRAARIAERFRQGGIYRGLTRLTVSEWAEERIRLCLELEHKALGATAPARRPRGKVKAWT